MALLSFTQAIADHEEKMAMVKNAPHFGYLTLTNMIPGLIPGQLTVVAGATSMGKTTFLANVSYNMAHVQKKRVLYASLESGASVAGTVKKISGLDNVERLKIYTSESAIDLNKLFKITKENIEHCEVLILDHIHYLATGKSNSISASIGEMIRNLQVMANNLGIPIIVVSHVRKLRDENSIPGLHDLKDSSALYQDPSTVIFIHRFKTDSQQEGAFTFSNKGVLIVAKNRDFGKTGVIKLDFNPVNLQFSLGDYA